ncbi:glycosyltransferase [Paenibacillus anaericanus]|uniref:Glycosyltransferase n=1 Tax=Paenibacillus anaericanus TaxID=170367 RepID=A0A3S1DPK5_9BACL|nr:glycosyltransferase [Paenibacillus anaericanus]RUT46120.1 glycosyltransferase [Paenibacillus anaericanus]
MKRLSLCIVTTGEDKKLERCLSSAHTLVDEIIIVNMEPTERARKIGASFGAKVFDFYKSGSYSDAGNYALEQATGDWILWMHGDEQLDHSDRTRLRDLLYMEQYDLIFLHVLQYGTTNHGRLRIFDIACPRLFRNGIKFQIFSKFQEMLNYSELTSEPGEEERVGIYPLKIHDYRQKSVHTKNKSNALRELDQLGRQIGQTEENNHWYAYHLACEYYRLQVYRPGFKYLNNVIKHYLDAKELPPSIIYKLKYSVVLDEVSTEEVDRGLQLALRMHPDYVDFQFYSGVIHFRKKLYAEGLHYFERCMELGEKAVGSYLVRKGVGSYQAAYYKGLSLEKMGNIEEATESYIESLAMNNSFKPPLEALKRLMGFDFNFEKLTNRLKGDHVINLTDLRAMLDVDQKVHIQIKKQVHST